MRNNTVQYGFTLIELLVVIAIIGILSSVVLSALSSARAKGIDTSIKSNLANLRVEAQTYYELTSTLTYQGVCALTGTNTIGDSVNASEKARSGGVVTAYADVTPSTWNTAQCHDSANGWVVWVPLKASTSASPAGWCVDSTGAAEHETTILIGDSYRCP